jgi:hypothetical protein
VRPKAAHSMTQTQQRRQCPRVDMRISRNTYPGACRSVEHPSRNLKPVAVQATAKDNAIRLRDRLVKADAKASPRMLRI